MNTTISDSLEMRKKLEVDLEIAERNLRMTKDQIAELQKFKVWDDCKKTDISSNDCSRAHNLAEAMSSDMIIYTSKDFDGEKMRWNAKMIFDCSNIFVIKHDWLSAFGESIDNFDDFNLPYDLNIFEFLISGKPVCIICFVVEGIKYCVCFIKQGNYWIETGEDSWCAEYCWKQVRAICIALESEIAEREVIMAPLALNAKRDRNGKPKLKDFHILNLAKRHRATSTINNGSGNRKRLHFRRGHWRHYENSKTWIKWMLVGNPELGFIDKQYSV